MSGRNINLVLALLVIAQITTGVSLAEVASGGPVAARIEIPQGQFTVGDPIELKLTVTHPPGAVFEFPDVAGAFSHAPAAPPGSEATTETGPTGVATLMVEEVKPLPSTEKGAGSTTWSIRMRVFSPGQRVLPAVTLSYQLTGSTEKAQVSTEPVTINVASVLKSKEDSAADIKGQWLLPREWLPWLIAGAIALALLALAIYLWRRRRRKPVAKPLPVVAPVVPAEHPYDRAVRELAALVAGKLLAEGRVKEFHVALSEIVKRLLGAVHRFDALDRTTEEVMADMLSRPLPPGLPEETGRFLRAADLVKFAKHHPDRTEISETVEAARRIIDTCRPAPVATGSGVAA